MSYSKLPRIQPRVKGTRPEQYMKGTWWNKQCVVSGNKFNKQSNLILFQSVHVSVCHPAFFVPLSHPPTHMIPPFRCSGSHSHPFSLTFMQPPPQKKQKQKQKQKQQNNKKQKKQTTKKNLFSPLTLTSLTLIITALSNKVWARSPRGTPSNPRWTKLRHAEQMRQGRQDRDWHHRRLSRDFAIREKQSGGGIWSWGIKHWKIYTCLGGKCKYTEQRNHQGWVVLSHYIT